MNNRELYLAWVRSNAPQAYLQALRKISGKARGLGGLGDDLLQNAIGPDASASVGDSRIPPDVFRSIMSGHVPRVRMARQRRRRFGGLGDDSMIPAMDPSSIDPGSISDTFTPADISFDTSSIDTGFSPDTTSYFSTVDTGAASSDVVTTPTDTVYAPSSNLFSSFLSAVGSVVGAAAPVATAIFSSQATANQVKAATQMAQGQTQASLLALNTQRAAAGLAPVNQFGQPIAATSLTPTSPSVLALESKIASTAGIAGIPTLGIVAIGLGLAYALFFRRRAA